MYRENLENKITIGNIYRPPRFNNNNVAIQNFITEFRPIIEKLSKEKSNCFLAGDFNINLLKVSLRNKYEEFLNLLVTHGFLPRIVNPTRLSKRRGTLIDNLFFKFTDKTSSSHSGIIHTHISDHLPCFTAIDYPKKKKVSPRFIKIQKKDTKSIDAFTSDIETRMQNFNLNQHVTADPNENYNEIIKTIKTSYDSHLAPKTV